MEVVLLLLFMIFVFVAAAGALFRTLFLLPAHAIAAGWAAASKKYAFSIAVSAAAIAFQAANFTGFSWTRFKIPSEDELVDAAIKFEYRNVYQDRADLAKDYSIFRPTVTYWDDWTLQSRNMYLDKFVGLKEYQIKLPDAIVVVDVSGVVRYSRGRGDEAVAPNRPILGVIGTIQYDSPVSRPLLDFSLDFDGKTDRDVLKADHCFAAAVTAVRPTITVIPKNEAPVKIREKFGYYLVVVRVHPNHFSSYGRIRISEADFAQWRTCEPQLRKSWPNVGGARWIR